MSAFVLLDPGKTGKQAEELENSLRHRIVGQEEAIHQIVRAYQTHVAGLSRLGGRSGIFYSWGLTGLRKNARCRGNRRGSAERFPGCNQDRLRGVSTQP